MRMPHCFRISRQVACQFMHSPEILITVRVQDASGAKHGSDPQSALREAEEAVKGMDLLRGMWDLEYPPHKLLQRISRAHTSSRAHIFNPSGCSTTLLGSLLMHGPIPLSLNRVNFVPQVHPCAKIAMGVSSCASKVCSALISFLLHAHESSV